MGGPVAQRILMAIDGLDYFNNDHPEGRNITDHFGSITDGVLASEPRKMITVLTPAERLALNAIIEHGTTKSAAMAVGLSHHTIRDQLKTARYKLDAKNTTHAVAIAIRAGLL